jgi:hypothetical protein
MLLALRKEREAVVRHMESKNVHDFDTTIATFAHTHYELVPSGASAAKASAARMSSRSRFWKLLRISSLLVPLARYSRMSPTVIRRPRMHGRPPHWIRRRAYAAV